MVVELYVVGTEFADGRVQEGVYARYYGANHLVMGVAPEGANTSLAVVIHRSEGYEHTREGSRSYAYPLAADDPLARDVLRYHEVKALEDLRHVSLAAYRLSHIDNNADTGTLTVSSKRAADLVLDTIRQELATGRAVIFQLRGKTKFHVFRVDPVVEAKIRDLVNLLPRDQTGFLSVTSTHILFQLGYRW